MSNKEHLEVLKKYTKKAIDSTNSGQVKDFFKHQLKKIEDEIKALTKPKKRATVKKKGGKNVRTKRISKTRRTK